MSWGEALRLIRLLRVDPSSQFAASIEGWPFPIDRTTSAVLDLYDFQVAVRWVDSGKKGAKPKAHPGRPVQESTSGRRFKRAPHVTDAQVVAAMRRAGHAAPV